MPLDLLTLPSSYRGAAWYWYWARVIAAFLSPLLGLGMLTIRPDRSTLWRGSVMGCSVCTSWGTKEYPSPFSPHKLPVTVLLPRPSRLGGPNQLLPKVSVRRIRPSLSASLACCRFLCRGMYQRKYTTRASRSSTPMVKPTPRPAFWEVVVKAPLCSVELSVVVVDDEVTEAGGS